jgi:hypothetical protein
VSSKSFELSLKKSLKTSHINEKTSIYLEIILTCLGFFEKALHHFKKASITLKISSKSLVIFEEASDFLLKPSFF